MNATMTEIEIDKSHLPRVFDVCQCFSVLEDSALAHSLQEQEIERFYSGNVQKRQDEQDDGRLARRLQDEEEQGARLSHCLRQLEEQDWEYAKMIEEDLRRHEEEEQRREEEDKEMARQLQEEEELQIRRQRAKAGWHDDGGASPLNEGLEVWGQVMRDAELARRLQEEEDREHRGPHMDFHAAQVAQDKEIARYMQRQERRSRSRSHDLGAPRRSHDPMGTVDPPLRKVETLLLPRERLNSEGLSSPVDEPALEQLPLSPEDTTLGAQSVHNIAEDLDPTFTARKRESEMCRSSSGIHLAPRTPHSIFYDYLPEPAFVPPSRRHADQTGRDRVREKRQNCKQQ